MAVFNQQDAVGRLGQTIVVRDHDECHAHVAIHLAHQGEDSLSRLAIEVARGLVR